MATEDLSAQEGLATTPAAQNEAETEVKATESEEVSAEQAENQEDQTKEEQPQPEEEPKRNANGSQKLRAKVARLEAELAEVQRTARPSGDDIEARIRARIGEPPKEADYNGDYIAYERKLTAYETAAMLARGDVTQEIERAKVNSERARRETEAEFREKVDDAAKRIPDFQQVINSAKDAYVADHVTALIQQSDKPGEVMYQLAKSPDLLDELNELTPLQAARRLGAIEARLTTPQPKKATGAPPPSAAVRGGSAPSSTWSGFEAWERKTYPHKYK